MSPEQTSLFADPVEPAAPAPVAENVPTEEQRAAIDARESPVFCEAGAGSGKTRVLVERYCAAVTEDEVVPDHILAFTFTDRASAELRQRVRRELGRRARALSDAGDTLGGAQLARLARDTERAWITTIHGFCKRLLAAHPAAAGLDPRFRVLDEAEATRLGERAFTSVLEELVASGDERVIRLASGYRLDRLSQMVRFAHDRLRSQGCDPPRLPEAGDPVRSMKKKDEAPLSAEEVELARAGHEAVVALLDGYSERYAQAKADRSGLDFEDLQLSALRLLEADGPIRELWRGRFEHLMVDEFQDTNRVQLAIVDALRGPDTRLFTVGDEFQSIYRFRHADLEVFRARRRQAEADSATEVLPLRGNFRSQPDILATVNLVGHVLLGDHYAPLSSGLDREGGPPPPEPIAELLLTDCSDDKQGQETGWRAPEIDLEKPPSETNPVVVAEARALAERLRELYEAGTDRGEMVVLLRAFTHVDAYEEALQRAGLAPYVVGGRGYWSQQQVEDLLRILGTIANPRDDEVLFGALASPACGASPDALWLLRMAAGAGREIWPVLETAFGTPSGDAAEAQHPEHLAGIGPVDGERLRNFCGTLAQLRAEAPLLSLDALVERAMTAFDYDVRMLERRSGRQRMANVRKLMRLASTYEEGEGRDLRGFLDFAEERTERDDREGLAAMHVEGHDGVRVMTVHAAKGLEFDVVAVADLSRALSAGASSADVAIGRLEREVGDPVDARFGMRIAVPAGESVRLWELVELEDEERRDDAQEGCRLTYVAATRARERLLLSGTFTQAHLEPPAEEKPSQSALRRLLPALAERGWDGGDATVELDPAPRVDGSTPRRRAVLGVRRSAPSEARAAELRKRWYVEPTPDAPPEHPGPALLSERQPTHAVPHLSYSALSAYERCGYRYYAERVIGLAPEDAEPSEPVSDRKDGRAIGNTVHAALEWSARNRWQEPSGDQLAAFAVRWGLTAKDSAARAGELVRGWLGSPLRAGLGAARPEVPFAVQVAGTVIRGKLDLLAGGNGDGVSQVVDYKTDALDGRDPAEVATRYEIQRDLYALAVWEAGGSEAGAVHTIYSFLERPDQPVEAVYDAERIEAARERAAQLIDGIRHGRFERTSSPYPALCFGCPAAARLCGAPAWRP